MDIDRYRYLWDGSHPDWVLVREPSAPGEGLDAFDIFNEKTRMMFVVDDENLARALVGRMRDEGVKVLDSVPADGPY